MTFSKVVEKMQNRGANLADLAVGRMMDIIEEETGRWPKWSDEAPGWVLEACGLADMI